MSQNNVIITINLVKEGIKRDLDVPLDISANDLCEALFERYIPLAQNDMNSYYLKAEKPIALLRGERTLRDYGIRDGSIINITR